MALILLLDQFTRNLYRGTVEAYAGDAYAFEIVNDAVGRGLHRALHPVAAIWLLHPFHHCEDVAEQDRGLGLLRALRQDADPAWHAYVERSIEGWTGHRDIVARFGRFPHRNAVLGRDSTAGELAYLAANGKRYGPGTAGRRGLPLTARTAFAAPGRAAAGRRSARPGAGEVNPGRLRPRR